MLDRVPPAQRRLVLLTAVAAVAAGVFVAVAVILATGEGTSTPEEYQPFRIGRADRLAEQIRDRPVFFADPTGGERGFALALHDGDFVALHVVTPGGSAECPIDWAVEDERFEDCDGRVWTPPQLARFDLRLVEEDGVDIVVVDLRRRLPPRAAGPGGPDPAG